MILLKRDAGNPLLSANSQSPWEHMAAFNPSVAVRDGITHLVYRAQSGLTELGPASLSLASVGYARRGEGLHFSGRRQLIRPELPWERYGCEDPRVTFFEGRYYIFYTCLSVHPFEPRGIRLAVAVTEDFEHVEKHPVTPFNAKAMALFPERVGGKIAAILTVHTDMPPAKVAIARFDHIEDLWSQAWWEEWYRHLDEHVVALLRRPQDQVEVGAPPLRTPQGWLLVHSYIRDYFSQARGFGIEAALLDEADPRVVRARTQDPMLQPEAHYEVQGCVANVVFPSGAAVEGEDLVVYYGAADTHCCTARCRLADLMEQLTPPVAETFIQSHYVRQGFQRFSGNPILVPRAELRWEAKACFNPGALWLEDRVHLLYRAMSVDGTSSLGYASSRDGVHLDERPARPVYEPSAAFEQKLRPGNSGCEDPRLTLLDGSVYVFYTAFDGQTPRVAYTALPVEDFLAKRWHWRAPVVITPPGVDDKDACLLSRRIDGDLVVFHRFDSCIRVNRCQDLGFGEGRWLDDASAVISPRTEYWDNRKFGIAAPPLETPHGWLLLFHRVTKPDGIYKVEAMLLDRNDPSLVLADTAASLLEPETPEERVGQTPNVVFPCGAVVMNGQVYLYYGAADSVVCVARMALDAIYKRLGI